MSNTAANPPALVLIDIQKGLDDMAYWGGERNNPDAEDRMGELLQLWRQQGWPLFHVRHDSTNPNSRLVPGQAGNEFKDVVTHFFRRSSSMIRRWPA